ncbi:hypothetical protein DL990_20040 [Amycolatopsis sp. WAC 01416]|uniref:hypothetical protein n=1 Tax=Amycolatopsis sp. WAC 01416 TaxID=2203196 RepID=UPI000F7B7B37|nr:hypothetical protein [Amycolatopsis sp. WAC 01416]RSN32213.1 hypothetical protein DL990_20040 [Amycolatopsis sp. WAC 01416]
MPEEELTQRVARLERQVAELTERSTDAAAARVLAAGADRDVSEVRAELRAHTGTLNALRQDQVDLREEMREGFAAVNRSLQQIIGLLGGPPSETETSG